jgi:DNA helicase HerA-like ATPase
MVRIGSRNVCYQIVNGLTKEEIVKEKNKRGYIRGEAIKIGTWNEEKNRFEKVKWLPTPNSQVMLLDLATTIPIKEAVGHFPRTNYPVFLNIDSLVTHNSAILGILGIGKSYLAVELVERIIANGIKVICLDLTDQYSIMLSKYYDATAQSAEVKELNTIGIAGKALSKRIVEEGGSINEFSAKIKEHIGTFLNPSSTRMLTIYNPTHLEVWRQDSRQYPDGHAAMASLTPCEIARIVSESALDVLQKQGMTDKGRCCLVYEEAHSLIPEGYATASEGDKTASNGTARAILQGRKFGLGCMVVTQRTASVTKSILNQCNTVFALRSFDATGIEFLKNYIGEDYAAIISALEDRYAVIFGRASSCNDPVLIRLNDRDDFLRVFRKTEST